MKRTLSLTLSVLVLLPALSGCAGIFRAVGRAGSATARAPIRLTVPRVALPAGITASGSGKAEKLLREALEAAPDAADLVSDGQQDPRAQAPDPRRSLERPRKQSR